MANKRISDLQLRANFDGSVNLAGDDASQTWRTTGAQILAYIGAAVGLITDRTEDTDPQGVDMVLTWDASAGALKKVSKKNWGKRPVATLTASHTVGADDDVSLENAASAAIVATLPTAVGISGKMYTFKKIDSSANAVTITPQSGQTIDGAASYALTVQYESIAVISNGANWSIL